MSHPPEFMYTQPLVVQREVNFLTTYDWRFRAIEQIRHIILIQLVIIQLIISDWRIELLILITGNDGIMWLLHE